MDWKNDALDLSQSPKENSVVFPLFWAGSERERESKKKKKAVEYIKSSHVRLVPLHRHKKQRTQDQGKMES